MKSIFSRIATKVGMPSGLRELEIVRRFRKTDKKAEKEEEKEEEEMEQGNEAVSNPSDEEEESEVVDILIKMKNHLKITRINSALQGEYQTLRHINRMLCSNPLRPEDIRLFLLTKSS